MSSKIEIDDLIYHFETKDAYCVSTEEDEFGEEAERIFLPKSIVDRSGPKEQYVFTMSEYIAQEKGLI